MKAIKGKLAYAKRGTKLFTIESEILGTIQENDFVFVLGEKPLWATLSAGFYVRVLSSIGVGYAYIKHLEFWDGR